MYQEFDNKTVLIFGGTSGIGLEAAKMFKKCGAKVYISSRTKKNTKNAGVYLPCDVANVNDVASVVKQVVEETGGIDILINSMGLAGNNKIENIEVDEWNSVYETNMFGVFATCKEVIPFMRKISSEKKI